jgi:hypothetical protein
MVMEPDGAIVNCNQGCFVGWIKTGDYNFIRISLEISESGDPKNPIQLKFDTNYTPN